MLTLRIDGVELGAAVGFLAIVWVFLSTFTYLLWYRLIKDKLGMCLARSSFSA